MLLTQLSLELVIVANDSVVNDCDSPTMVEMGVRIDICLVTVRGPPSMTDCHVMIMRLRSLNSHPLYAIAAEPVCRSELSRDPGWLTLFIISDRNDTAAVVATRFKDLKTLDADRACLRAITQVAHDAAAFILLS